MNTTQYKIESPSEWEIKLCSCNADNRHYVHAHNKLNGLIGISKIFDLTLGIDEVQQRIVEAKERAE